MEADEERIKLEKLAEELSLQEDDEAQEYLMEVSKQFVESWLLTFKLISGHTCDYGLQSGLLFTLFTHFWTLFCILGTGFS